jgi:hypothetical protein
VGLASVTPLILTYNEEPKIGRTLDRLTEADRAYETAEAVSVA